MTPGWTLRDHVGHLADWVDEGARAIAVYRDTDVWLADPEEGIDAWNERHVAARRDETPRETLARYDAARVATAREAVAIADGRGAALARRLELGLRLPCTATSASTSRWSGGGALRAAGRGS